MHDTYSTKPGIVDIEIHYCKVLILCMECDIIEGPLRNIKYEYSKPYIYCKTKT